MFRSRPISVRLRVRGLLAGGFAFAVLFSSVAPVAAAAGELDDTFDGNGKLTINPTTHDDWLYDLAIQPADQKIVVVGGSTPTDTEWSIIRLNPDGSLDGTFGGGDASVAIDFSTGEDFASAVALQADGKIVVVGRSGTHGGSWGIARLNTDGTLDTTFSTDGKRTINFTSGIDQANDVTIDDDQKIVVTGSSAAADSRFIVARINSNGSMDMSFNADGIASMNLTSLPDIATSVDINSVTDRIAVAGIAGDKGGQIGVARFDSDGSADPHFNGAGSVVKNLSRGQDAAYAVDLLADDSIILGGRQGPANSRFLVMKFAFNGLPDTTFSGDGRSVFDITIFDDPAYGMAVQADGKIVLVGTANLEFLTVIRVNADGTRDTSFGDDGEMYSNVTADYDVGFKVAIQDDGNIVVAGSSGVGGGEMTIARFLGS